MVTRVTTYLLNIGTTGSSDTVYRRKKKTQSSISVIASSPVHHRDRFLPNAKEGTHAVPLLDW